MENEKLKEYLESLKIGDSIYCHYSSIHGDHVIYESIKQITGKKKDIKTVSGKTFSSSGYGKNTNYKIIVPDYAKKIILFLNKRDEIFMRFNEEEEKLKKDNLEYRRSCRYTNSNVEMINFLYNKYIPKKGDE